MNWVNVDGVGNITATVLMSDNGTIWQSPPLGTPVNAGTNFLHVVAVSCRGCEPLKAPSIDCFRGTFTPSCGNKARIPPDTAFKTFCNKS